MRRESYACAESTRSCILTSGNSLVSNPSKAGTPFAPSSSSSTRVCIESGTSSGVIGREGPALSLLEGERKKFLLAEEGGECLGLSSFSRTESRFWRMSSSEGRDWPKPCDEATCSMDLKYCRRG